MDLITIDVSKVPMKKLYLGKPVEIIGINQSYENIAYDTETNEHEILISLGRNLSRVYF
jgi:alanine racemase